MLVPLAFDVLMLAIAVVPHMPSPQFAMPIPLRRRPRYGGRGQPLYPLYVLPRTSRLSGRQLGAS